MKALDWRKARVDSKPKLSVVDEQEYRGRDAAARWLERNSKPVADKKQKRHRKLTTGYGAGT